MNKLKRTHRALYRGMCTLISNACSAIFIVLLDQIQKAGTDIPTQGKYGVVSLSGVHSPDMDDLPLDTALLLDTHDDICTKMMLHCGKCGSVLEVEAIREEPEVAVMLTVKACEICIANSFHTGYSKGEDRASRGF